MCHTLSFSDVFANLSDVHVCLEEDFCVEVLKQILIEHRWYKLQALLVRLIINWQTTDHIINKTRRTELTITAVSPCSDQFMLDVAGEMSFPSEEEHHNSSSGSSITTARHFRLDHVISATTRLLLLLMEFYGVWQTNFRCITATSWTGVWSTNKHFRLVTNGQKVL